METIKAIRKEMECSGHKNLVISDSWKPGTRYGEKKFVVFEVTGPQGGYQGVFALTREEAGDLGRFLVEYYGEEG